jgi:hypothetical protein
MAIKRYVAEKDTVITNAYKFDNLTRATGSNMGAADSLEVFSLYSNAFSGSTEKARTLIQFPIDDISADRTAGDVAASGSAAFFLRVFNVRHDKTLPRDLTVVIYPVSSSWDEGDGIDLDNYKDRAIGNSGSGASWEYANSGASGPVAWGDAGGVFHTAAGDPYYTYSFEKGTEDIDLEITDLVEEWIAGTKTNNGLVILLTSSQEDNVSYQSYYTKRFSARSSEYYFRRPVIEARWDDSRKDNRGNFFASASNASSADNLNTIYFYNFVRGQLTDLPATGSVGGTGAVFVYLYTDEITGTKLDPVASAGDALADADVTIQGGWVATGIYSATFALDTTASVFYDRWVSNSASATPVNVYHTGTINVEAMPPLNIGTLPQYATKITNLKPTYSTRETKNRFRVFTRERNWSPNIYTVAYNDPVVTVVEDAYYRIVRSADSYEVVSYGTGSNNSTRMSYDLSGSYFDFDMSMLEAGYKYNIKFAYNLNGNYVEQDEDFFFRVDD